MFLARTLAFWISVSARLWKEHRFSASVYFFFLGIYIMTETNVHQVSKDKTVIRVMMMTTTTMMGVFPRLRGNCCLSSI